MAIGDVRRPALLVAGMLLAVPAASEAAGQPGGLFQLAAPTAAASGSATSPDSLTLRRRLVAIDFGQLAPPASAAETGGAPAGPSGVLRLNLFDDAVFTGLVERTAPTFSGGYALSGRLAGIEMSAVTLVVNGEVVAGTVRTPETTYRIRPAGGGLHAVSQIDPARLPPLGEPLPRRPGYDGRPPIGPLVVGGGPPVRPLAVDVVARGSAASDRAALEALYHAAGGAEWTNSTNWLTDAPLADWFGVTTAAGGRVTRLDLRRNALRGSIPSELGNLANLQFLDLTANELSGPIPTALGNLANLQSLHILSSQLSGPIPTTLGNLANLRFLNLQSNRLSGQIPPELGNLVNLQQLILGGNRLDGQIPPELGNLANLQILSLGGNRLSGQIPPELGNLVNLDTMYLGPNALTGPIPATLGNLANLRGLTLRANALRGSVTAGLAGLTNLEYLDLSYNVGLSGAVPVSLSRLSRLDIWMTRACAPAAWRALMDTGRLNGALCGARPVTIDVAVVYTPAARRAAGSTAAIEAVIDLMIVETNQAYAASGVDHRIALAARSEVPYTESGDKGVDLGRLADPSDGYMDEVHATRDRTEADLVHLIYRGRGSGGGGGIADLIGPFGVTCLICGGYVFAHELGHNMGLEHDRYRVHHHERGVSSHPAYGYVNQRAFEPGAAQSSRWRTIMAYGTQCADAGFGCSWLHRFSNPRQTWLGDPLGVAFDSDALGVMGPADAAAVLDATAPVVAGWRGEIPGGANQPPVAVGRLPDRQLSVFHDAWVVDVSPAFIDPDGDALSYTAAAADPAVVTAHAAGVHVTLEAVAAGASEVRVTATDPGGLGTVQSFTATVPDPGLTSGQYDRYRETWQVLAEDSITSGATRVRAVHFTELRRRIDGLREEAGLESFPWTDPVLRAGATPVRLAHLLELREALAGAYAVASRAAPRWTDPVPVAGSTPIRAAHLTELRAAVMALD